MKRSYRSDEERALAESFERGEWRPVKNVKRERQKLRDAARRSLQKDARINIRLSSKDLGDVQVIAAREGIPCQTLLSSIIHKYVSGWLTEKREGAERHTPRAVGRRLFDLQSPIPNPSFLCTAYSPSTSTERWSIAAVS
jgi:predicted DNA binding CopG/RHH family protein